MQIIIENKEELSTKIYDLFLDDFLESLEATDLSQEEKDANVVLAKRKMQGDADNLTDVIYKAYGLE